MLWEGVVHYIDREAVKSTLRAAATTASGSVIAFDYFTTEPLTSKSLYWHFGRAAAKAAGEPPKFGIDSTPPSRARCRTAPILWASARGAAHPRERDGGKRAWGGFAVAIVKRDREVR